MGAGESASERAASAADAARRLRQEHADGGAPGEGRGVDAERRLAGLLASLESLGCRTLAVDQRERVAAGLDVVAVGHGGVFVIDAEAEPGLVEVRGGQVLHGGRVRTGDVRRLLDVSTGVRAALTAAGVRETPVWPMMAFPGETGLDGVHPFGGAYVTGGQALVELVRQAPCALDVTWMDWIRSTLAAATALPVAEAEATEARAPDEAVVFLTPWCRHGQRRYYARDEEGTSGGYLDLVSGSVVDQTPLATRVLGQVLPHYLHDLRSVGLSEEDERGIRRFLTALGTMSDSPRTVPLVIGTYSAPRGRRRLQVRQLSAAGSMQELGWYDLDRQKAFAEPDVEAEVRYCGERYLMTDVRG